MLADVMRSRVCLSFSLVVLACSGEPDSRSQEASAGPAKPDETGQKRAAEALGDRASFASSELFDLEALLGGTPTAVDAQLGSARESTQRTSSCVRFVPERVFFECAHDFRLYDHPRLDSVRVDFQDGVVGELSLSGLPGDGAVGPEAALALVGLSLPGVPRYGTPEPETEVWSWGNDGARLLVGGRQFRVRLSVIGQDWARSKLEFLDNSPLSAEQRERIMAPKGSTP